jgi:adenylate kinase family enzyme
VRCDNYASCRQWISTSKHLQHSATVGEGGNQLKLPLSPQPERERISDLSLEMGVRNYLIEGVSGTGKTTVAEELQRRGYHVLHGDRELAYQGDPKTGEPVDEPAHESEMDKVVWQQRHHLWDIDKVKSVIADHSNAISFFCGGSRNFVRFIDLLDGVFVLDVDLDTLERRLASRPEDEFGGRAVEQELVVRLHATKEDIPKGDIVIDATAPLASVVDEILSKCREGGQGDH